MSIKQVSRYANPTSKYTFNVKGIGVPSALIRRPDKDIICVSTMSGCPVRCIFCASGSSYFGRLSGRQVASVVRSIYERETLGEKPLLVSFMGAGEPLLNCECVLDSVKELDDITDRFAFSTSGVGIDNLPRLSAVENLKMQMSVHCVVDTIRSAMIPNTPTLDEIMMMIQRAWYERPIDYNFIFIQDLNDYIGAEVDIEAFCQRWGISRIKVNRFHPELGLIESKKKAEIVHSLIVKGLAVEEYYTDGSDIKAACGQMKVERFG